jgi:hypothetical protein
LGRLLLGQAPSLAEPKQALTDRLHDLPVRGGCVAFIVHYTSISAFLSFLSYSLKIGNGWSSRKSDVAFMTQRPPKLGAHTIYATWPPAPQAKILLCVVATVVAAAPVARAEVMGVSNEQ